MTRALRKVDRIVGIGEVYHFRFPRHRETRLYAFAKN